jgi:hypothetical protein
MLKAKTKLHLVDENSVEYKINGTVNTTDADFYFNEHYVQGIVLFMDEEDPYIELIMANGLSFTIEYEEELLRRIQEVL